MKSKIINGKRVIPCDTCGEEAEFLIFYTKLYHHGLNTVEYPALVCEACRAGRKAEAYRIDRGGDQQVYELSFKEIGSYQPYQISRLCSLKGRELNYLHLKAWRDRIWEVHYASQPPKNKS